MRYLRLLLASARLNVLAALQYRIGFFTDGVLGMLWSMMGIVPLLVALSHRPTVAGWGPWELLVFTGCFTALQGIFGALLHPNLLGAMEHIRSGTLDYLLLRPADSLFLCLTSSFSPWRLLEFFAGVALVITGVIGVGTVPDPLAVLSAVGLWLCGIATLYAIGILAVCASFRALKLENLTFLLEASLDFGRWPISVFRGPIKALFTFVVPLAVMISFPAQALVGRLDAGALGVAIGVTVAFTTVARLWWVRSLRHYTSASS